MKKTKSVSSPARPLYALLLAAVVLLLWLLAQPRPGVRILRLKPILAPEADSPVPAVPGRLRIATYNLEHFTDGRRDGPERTPDVFIAHAQAAAEIIAEADPDILLLQEVENGRVLEFLNEQFEHPYSYIYVTQLRSSSGRKDKLNLALLSRVRPVRVRELSFHQLEGPGRPTRGSLAAEFDLGRCCRLLTYNIHLKSNYGEAPRNQAQRGIALHHIAADALGQTYKNTFASNITYTLVLGDTNVDPDSEGFADDPSLAPLSGSFADLWLGRPIEERTTIPTREAGETGDPLHVFPPSAFDRVFASTHFTTDGNWTVSPPQAIQRGTDTTNNTTLPGLNGHISDHHLVFVDLTHNRSKSAP